jgi:glutaredoxin 3
MNIEIYGTTICPFCVASKELLKSKNIKFKYKNLDDDPKLRDKMAKELNYYTVPMIFIDKKFIGGFSDLQKIQSTL